MLFYPLNQTLFFMGFDSLEEANWVMENKSRIFRSEVLHLHGMVDSINKLHGKKRPRSRNLD